MTSLAAPRRALPTPLWSVPLVLALGFLSGWLSNSGYGNAWFAGLRKPAFMPPPWAFPVAWTLLYAMTGLAAGLVADAAAGPRRPALAWFGVQLVLNLAWSPVFFGLHAAGPALGLILALIVAALATAWLFARVRPAAGWLMLPYLAWLGLAAALNGAILALNPG